MGRKQKDDAPNPSNIVNRDIFQRLNFLYQSSVYLSSLPSGTSSEREKKQPAKNHVRKFNGRDLSRSYIDTMKSVGRKTTVKIDPAVKRTICEGCNLVLIPGTTASFKVKPSASHGHALVYTCNECKTVRRIPAPPQAQAFGDDLSHDSTTEDADMTDDVLHRHVEIETVKTSRGQCKKRNIKPRMPPWSAREDAGHVLLIGYEQQPVCSAERGKGISIL